MIGATLRDRLFFAINPAINNLTFPQTVAGVRFRVSVFKN